MSETSVPDLVAERIVGGARLVFLGGLTAAVLTILGRTVVTRLYSPSVYGAFAIGLTVLFLVGVFGYGAFSRGISRMISFTLEEEDARPGVYATWGMVLVVVTSTLIAVVVALQADTIARVVFDERAYADAIRLVVLGLPFYGLIYGLASVLRGYGNASGRVLFLDVARTGSFPLVLAAAALLYGDAPAVAYAAYPVALALTAVAFTAYTIRHPAAEFETSLSRLRDRLPDLSTLVRFSLPLLFSGVFLQLMTRADTFMIGLFLPPAAVGQYAVVRPLLRPIMVVWGSMIWMYTPLVASLTAQDAMGDLQRVYLGMTKWFSLFTYPLAITVALFPEPILTAVFGPAYAPASTALRLVAVGYFLGNFFGPTGATLTGLGYTKALLAANAFAAVVNIGLNALLIPRYGLTGAALGTITAQGTRNLLRVAVLYRVNEIHALTTEFVGPTLLTTGVLVAAHTLLVRLVEPSIAIAALFAPVAFLTYLAAYPLTGSVNDDDHGMARLARQRGADLRRRLPTSE